MTGPARAAPPSRSCRTPRATLLAVVAAAGNDDRSRAERAFAAGVAALGLPARPFAPPRDFASALDAVWAPLDALDPRHKRR